MGTSLVSSLIGCRAVLSVRTSALEASTQGTSVHLPEVSSLGFEAGRILPETPRRFWKASGSFPESSGGIGKTSANQLPMCKNKWCLCTYGTFLGSSFRKFLRSLWKLSHRSVQKFRRSFPESPCYGFQLPEPEMGLVQRLHTVP